MTNWSIHLFMTGHVWRFQSSSPKRLETERPNQAHSALSSLASILEPAVEHRCPLVAERLRALPRIGVVVGDGRSQRNVLERMPKRRFSGDVDRAFQQTHGNLRALGQLARQRHGSV